MAKSKATTKAELKKKRAHQKTIDSSRQIAEQGYLGPVLEADRKRAERRAERDRKKITPSPGRRNKIASFSLRPNTIRRLNEIAERRGQSGEFCSKSGIIDELVKREARKYKGIE